MISEIATGDAGQAEGYPDIIGNKVVMALVKEIYSSVIFGKDKLKAVMNLPPVSQVDNETLSLALQCILENYFHLSFPSEKLNHIRAGRSVKFLEEQPAENLPPRRVSILLSPEHRSFEVLGVMEENGKDGYSELLFSWETQPGQVDTLGNIDLKRLNTYPNVFAEQPLATVYLRTEGKPGVNSLGKKIKQCMGQPLKVRYNEATIYQKEDAKDKSKYQLVTRKGGIVDYILSRKNDPRSLAKVDILDTITINGDVNYAIGDQGSLTNKHLECTSNIDVKGSVLGVFSLQSTGYIRISGAFEGKKAVAEEIIVDIVTSGSKVTARRDVVASNVIHGVVEGNTIILRKNANEARLVARELIRLEQNASCLGSTMSTRKLESAKNRFAGKTTVYLGEDLFSLEKELLTSLQTGDEEMAKGLPGLKEAAAGIVNSLASIESHIKLAGALQHQEVKKLLVAIKQMLVTAIQSMSTPLSEKMIPCCYRLQSLLGEKKVHESVLRKIESFIHSLKSFNQVLEIQQNKAKDLQKIRTELAALQADVQQLVVDLQHPTFLGHNAELRIVCGDSEIRFNEDTAPARHFSVTYHLEEDAVGLRKGTLKVSSEGGESF